MGLYEKLFKIMEQSENLDKSMEVGSGTYKYNAISEKEVLNKVKPLLKENKIIILPVDLNITELETRKMTQLKVIWKVIDVETGEFEMLASPGNGADSQDKGSGKAWTYAYKALFQKMFCMFSGEDTDNTHSNDIDNSNYGATGSKVSADDLFDAISDSHNHTVEGVLKHYNDNRKEGTKAVSEIKYLPQTAKQYYYTKCKGESK